MGRDPGSVSMRVRARGMLRRAAWRAEPYVPGRRPPRLPEWTGPAMTLPPIVIGGTGRCGTSITARVAGQHPDYYLIPFEPKFISDPGGLADLVEGRTGIVAFERHLLGGWYRRTKDRGLHQITDPDTLRAAVRELHADLERDPILAAQRFTHRLLDPPAVAAGKHGWIENTPSTTRVAGFLTRLLPDARIVHLVRDGRDVACSLLTRTWGPNDLDEGLRWWARHLERSFEETRPLGEQQVLTLRMESLLLYDRDASFQRMVDFLDLGDEPAVRAFFEERVTAERAHIGRWHHDVPAEGQPAFLATYREASATLVDRWGYDADLIETASVPATT